MASAALASVIQLINQILPNLQSNFLLCPGEKMRSLHENLVFLQCFLQNFPENSGQTISDLEVRIQDVAYQAKDIIQSHVSKQDAAGDEEQFDAFERCINEVNSIVAEAKKMKEVTVEGDELPAGTTESSSVLASSRRAPVGKESMVGVDEDMIQIKDRVVGDEQNLQIIPITGMGGIGKTTLAINVYEDQLIIDYFDIRHWVTVSQEYSVRDILGRILSDEESIDENVELLIEHVCKSLKHRRYLIVMDDIWHAEVWDKVRGAFPNDYNGSRVIITTRLSEVVFNIDSDSPLHRMRLLDEDQSWALFHKKIYSDEYPTSHMEKIGKSIARNCKGLPLAIVVISGLLKANKTREYWENIAENVNVASTVNDDSFSGIFSLSYNNLPHQLKACFLYMGVFPEDYEISVKKLVKLWVADGFLEPVERKILEELAEEYLEDLVERSLILVDRKRSNGRMRSCRVHDVLRDLSIRKGREERFLQHFTDKDKNKNTFLKMVEGQCRLSICTNDLNFLRIDIHNSPVHSLLYFGSKSHLLSSIASQLKSLRVVDELLVDPEFFPDQIFELVNLRFLALTYQSSYCKISPSISKLQNLQTLIINWTSFAHFLGKVILPLEIWKMPQLRHLVVKQNGLFCFPYRDGLHGTYSVLENLQTLSSLLNFEFTKEAVEGFPNLKKLKILYYGIKPEGWAKFCLGNLVYLQKLEELNFELDRFAIVGGKPLPTNLSFPQRLRKLTLRNSTIPWEKMSMVGSMPNLEVLKLMQGSFVGTEWETTEGEFLVLTYLEMKCTHLMEWKVESSTHFPRLEKLIIRWCFSLKEVPSSVGDIPTLQILTMQCCNVEAEDSVRQIQEEQQSLGNDVLQVRIIEPS